MGINNPVPQNLEAECRKAARILASFIKPNQVFGPDKIIPPEVLREAKGLVILTVLKAGFLFSGRAGSGIVIARLPDGGWSAPSAIVTAGAGVGGQVGAELTDFVMILNTEAAVQSFSQFGSITLGGNVSVAAGPLGRNAEAAGSANFRNVAAVFSYSKTKGLFAGVSLEGSVLVERREANRKFYGNDCTSKQLLSGAVVPPPGADRLFRVLESRVFSGDFDPYEDDLYDDIPSITDSNDDQSYRSGSAAGRRGAGRTYSNDSFGQSPSRARRGGRVDDDDFDDDYRSSPRRGGRGGSGGAGGGGARDTSWEDNVYDRGYDNSRTRRFQRHHFESTYSDRSPSHDSRPPSRPSAPKPKYNEDNEDDDDYYSRRGKSSRPPSRPARPASNGGLSSNQVRAKFAFEGEQDGDLGFRKGDIITVTKKTDSTDDWWTGRINGREGIFPANYVESS